MPKIRNSSNELFDPSAPSPNYHAPVAQIPWLQKLPRLPKAKDLLFDGGASHPFFQFVAPPTKAPPKTLFQELLGGRTEVLQQDALEHPDRYEEPIQELLHNLTVGTKKIETLSQEEQGALNRAVIDFATYKPPPAVPVPKAPYRPKPTPQLMDESFHDGKEPQVEPPGGVLTNHWWRS
jgi:hypothetical protein